MGRGVLSAVLHLCCLKSHSVLKRRATSRHGAPRDVESCFVLSYCMVSRSMLSSCVMLLYMVENCVVSRWVVTYFFFSVLPHLRFPALRSLALQRILFVSYCLLLLFVTLQLSFVRSVTFCVVQVCCILCSVSLNCRGRVYAMWHGIRCKFVFAEQMALSYSCRTVIRVVAVVAF